jgi:hypothetical protein
MRVSKQKREEQKREEYLPVKHTHPNNLIPREYQYLRPLISSMPNSRNTNLESLLSLLNFHNFLNVPNYNLEIERKLDQQQQGKRKSLEETKDIWKKNVEAILF